MALSLRYKILLSVISFAAVYLYSIHHKLKLSTDGVFNLVQSIYYGLHNFILFGWIPIISLVGFAIGNYLKNEELKMGFMYSAIGTSVFYILVMLIY